MQGYPLLYHPSCSSEALIALGGLAHAAAWANVAPGQGMSYRHWFVPQGFPHRKHESVLAPPWWECSTSFPLIEAGDTACACKLT